MPLGGSVGVVVPAGVTGVDGAVVLARAPVAGPIASAHVVMTTTAAWTARRWRFTVVLPWGGAWHVKPNPADVAGQQSWGDRLVTCDPARDGWGAWGAREQIGAR
ncbi:hypothetical protein GCM10027446_07060 [Angustibacter peucedani]